MKTTLKLFFITIISISIFSCKKNQLGGKSSIKGVVMHHNKPIADAYVYIKFNSSEFPGDDYKSYDTYVQADANGNYKITLYKGTYYLYASGLDLDIPSPFAVKGGLSFTIKNKENITRDIAVTE
jgi:hypothetical protein